MHYAAHTGGRGTFGRIGTIVFAIAALLAGAAHAETGWWTNVPEGSGRTFYFSPSGSDANTTAQAQNPNTPWQIPYNHNGVWQPGDVISISGAYSVSTGFALYGSGTSAAYIEILCQVGSSVTVTGSPSTGQNAITIYNGAYWHVKGCNTSSSQASAMAIGSGASTAAVHHVIFEGNTAHDSACAGLGVAGNSNSTGSAMDYVAFVGNVVYGNAKTSGYHCSGISIYEPHVLDSVASTHIAILGNVAYDNYDCLSVCSGPTDGNGVIIDDLNDTQSAPHVVYTADVLVAGNLSVNNGGRGIHVFLSSNVLVENNTAWGNMRDPRICGTSAVTYEIGASQSSNSRFYQNVAQATTANNCPSTPSQSTVAIGELQLSGAAVSNNIYDYNIAFGVGGLNTAQQNSTNFRFGVYNPSSGSPVSDHNIYRSPLLAQPSAITGAQSLTTVQAAFMPTPNSPAAAPAVPASNVQVGYRP